jgi:acyl-CoA thioesterase-2
VLIEVPPTLDELLLLEQVGPDRFVGGTLKTGRARVFGGQVAAQAASAAAHTATPATVAGTSSVFIAAADPARPITFDVNRIRDGRGMTLRQVTASQDGRDILTSLVRLHGDGAGPAHSSLPPAVPAPEDCVSMRDAFDALGMLRGRIWEELDWIDVRTVATTADGGPAGLPSRTDHSAFWLRVTQDVSDHVQRNGLLSVMVTDLVVLAGSLLPHGFPFPGFSVDTPSFDHTVWVHRPVPAHRWLLFAVHSPRAGDGRAMGMGELFDGDELVATVAQEGLIRPSRTETAPAPWNPDPVRFPPLTRY